MKSKTVYTCQSCAAQFPKWMGKCPECNNWNTLVEETYQEVTASEAKGHAAFRKNLKESVEEENSAHQEPKSITEIEKKEGVRFATDFVELNRVLGGGIVPGSLILIGGDPGIGKSTILMQAFVSLAKNKDFKILYVSGEESPQQIKMRADRLGLHTSNFLVYAENNFEEIMRQVQKQKPNLLVIDSVQTIFSNQVQSAPGSVSQVRECTARIMHLAKTLSVATFIVGHVTKDGSIAGPKVLEHMVDTVLYFEGSTYNAYRILRAVKNRFGSTNEIGVFEMNSSGLREVTNPSELFLQERAVNASGTVVVSTIEGSRPLLVEIQALVSSSQLATPRRTTLGIDHNKVSLLVAVIEKKLSLPLYGHDIFVNVAGGIRIEEPSCDLGAALAMISSFKNKPISSKLLVCGEIGLTGEVRAITQLDLRLTEAAKLGFTEAIVPKSSMNALQKSGFSMKSMKIHAISQLGEAIDFLD